MGSIASPVAIVTGGSSGIGLRLGQRLASAGYDVVIVGRNRDRLEDALGTIGSEGALALCADVSRREDVARVVAEVLARRGRIDALVNNAGVHELVPIGTPLDEAEALFHRVVGASLLGAYLMSHACATHLPDQTGRVVNMGSIVGHTGGSITGYTAYAAAKAGLQGFTSALARDLGRRGITVNTVAPGFTANTGQTAEWTGARVDPIVARIPLARPGQPDDIAEAVLWLLSDKAAYVTGMTLPVNGGWAFYP